MKHKLLLLLFCIIATGNASAYDFEVDGLYYYKTSNKTVAVTYTLSDYPYNTADTYQGAVTIPSTVTYSGTTYSVTMIGSYAFYGCNSLTSIEIPNSITTIGGGAFICCENLTSVKIGDSVTFIGRYAFSNCYSLKSVEIPNSAVTTIGGYAFYHCYGLKSLKIPNSVTEIEGNAFSCCFNLASVEIGNSVTTIGSYAFEQCNALKSVAIPESVTEIGEEAFHHCDVLASITGKFASEDHRCLIIDGVLNAFARAGLTSYVISNSVTTIGHGAFYDCSDLTTIVIPESVKTLEDWALIGCTGLKEITSLNTTPPSVGYACFSSATTSSCVLKVPAEAVEAYKAAKGWKDFKNVVGINTDAITAVKGETSTGKAYDLRGAEVPEGYRGIVIQDGRKVLRK